MGLFLSFNMIHDNRRVTFVKDTVMDHIDSHMARAQGNIVSAVAGCPSRLLTVTHQLEALVPLHRLSSRSVLSKKKKKSFNISNTRLYCYIRALLNNTLGSR